MRNELFFALLVYVREMQHTHTQAVQSAGGLKSAHRTVQIGPQGSERISVLRRAALRDGSRVNIAGGGGVRGSDRRKGKGGRVMEEKKQGCGKRQ